MKFSCPFYCGTCKDSAHMHLDFHEKTTDSGLHNHRQKASQASPCIIACIEKKRESEQQDEQYISRAFPRIPTADSPWIIHRSKVRVPTYCTGPANMSHQSTGESAFEGGGPTSSSTRRLIEGKGFHHKPQLTSCSEMMQLLAIRS